MAGLLRHQNDVFCYVAHRDGVYHPIYVESEGPAAASPMVCLHCSLGPFLPTPTLQHLLASGGLCVAFQGHLLHVCPLLLVLHKYRTAASALRKLRITCLSILP